MPSVSAVTMKRTEMGISRRGAVEPDTLWLGA